MVLYDTVDCVIASGDTASAVVDIGNKTICGLLIPTLDSGSLTFQVSEKADGTFYTLKDKTPASHTIVATTGLFAVASDDLTELAGYRFIKIISAATQTAARTFIWVLK